MIISSNTKPIFSQTEIKKSKFISYLFSNSNLSQETIRSYIIRLHYEHPKAHHFVYASRYLNESSQIVESFSDNGEPKNSSAMPMLNVLRGIDLIQVCVVTIRYFGGIKLGVGGLMRAYGGSCKEVISLAQSQDLFQAYEKQINKIFFIEYKHLSLIEYQLKKYSINILKKGFLDNVELTIQSSENNIKNFMESNNIYMRGN